MGLESHAPEDAEVMGKQLCHAPPLAVGAEEGRCVWHLYRPLPQLPNRPSSSFRLGGPKVRRSRVPPPGLGRIRSQTLDVPARKLVGVVCFGEFESGSGKPTLGGAKKVLPGNDYVALVEVAVPSLDQPFELR